MVIRVPKSSPRRQAAVLTTDLMVAIAFLCLAVLPLALSFAQERRALLSSYQRAIAMEIVDGEMELLIAGEWRHYANGQHQLAPRANAATNLPPGSLSLAVTNKHLVLEWRPADTAGRSVVRREITLR